MDGSPDLPRYSGVPDPAVLLDTTRCPACFTPLATTRCSRCGLDVSAQGAGDVFAASQQLMRAIAVRDQALETMRAAQRQREATDATSTAAATATPAPPAATAPPVPPASRHDPADPGRPRRSGVQILLLVAGVAAVSVAVVFFALVAVLFATPQVRAAILATAALAVLAAGVGLRRRLPSTAEALTVAGLVMLLLDLLLVRTAFGLQGVGGTLYAGLGLLVVAAVGTALGAAARLRAGSIGAAALAPTGVLLIVLGALHHADSALAVWAATLGALLAGGVGLAIRRPVESAVLRVQGLLAALVALPVSASVPVAAPALHLLTVGAVAVVAALWLAAATTRRPTGFRIDVHLAACAAAVSVVYATGSAFQSSLGPIALLPVLAPVPAAAIVAAMRTSGARRTVAVAAAVVGGGVGLVYAGPGLAALEGVLAVPLSDLSRAPFTAGTRWTDAGPVGDVLIATAGIAVVLVLCGFAARRRGPWTAAAVVVACGALLAATASGTATVLLPAAVLVGAGCAAALARLGDDDSRAVTAMAVLGVALVAIACMSLRTVDLWPIAALAALGLTGAFRIASRSALCTSIASASFVSAIVLVAAAAGPWADATQLRALSGMPAAALPFVAGGSVLLVAALRGDRIARVERVAIEAVAAVALVAAGGALSVGLDAAAAASAAVGLGTSAAAALVWVRRTAAHGEAAVAGFVGPLLLAAAAAAAAFAAVGAPADAAGVPASVPLAGSIAVLAAAALAVGWVHSPRRDPWELSTAGAVLAVVAALPSAGFAASTAPLLLCAAAAAVLAFATGDAFRAGLRRRVTGFTGIGLLLAAIWCALSASEVHDVEPYTLPVAAALLAVAVVAAFRGGEPTARSGLASTGAALALVPSAIVAIGTDGPRGLAVAVAASALLLLSLVAPAGWRGIALRTPLGAIGAPVLGFIAVVELFRPQPAPIAIDAWWAPAALLLLGVAAFRLRRAATDALVLPPLISGSVVAGAAALEAGALRTDAAPRLVVAMLLLGCGAVAAAAVARTSRVAELVPLAIGGIVTAAATAARFGSDRPLELATMPFAATLLVAGMLRMRRDPMLRSWAALGPGIAVLLLPSLLLDVMPATTWRVVAVGVVALAVFITGAARQLSAPFLLGGGVFVVHVLVQLWPWIEQLYLSVWWLWIGVAGALLIAIAARYERRVRDLRQAVRLLSAQR